MKEREISFQLSAQRVDATAGIIYGVTIAKSGVNATGKYIFVDGNGAIVKDPAMARKKLPVMTDDRTLLSLLGAFQDAGGKVRTRIDHNDSISARAGFADNPHLIDDRVVVDVHLLKSFEGRNVILEVAERTPELIGMSIDMIPSFEIRDDQAFMRIEELTACDVVDTGAITPAGLFLNRGRVDNASSSDNPPSNPVTPPPMADPKQNPPQGPEALEAAIKTLTGRCDGLEAKHANLEAAHQDLIKKHEALEAKHGALEAAHNTLAGVKVAPAKTEGSPMEAAVTKLTEDLKAMRTDLVEMKKTSTALGMKPGGQEGSSADPNDPTGRKPAATPKTYLELVADKRAKDGKMSAAEAHTTVQRENADAYRLHQESLGIWAKTKT